MADYPENWWVSNGKCRLLELPDDHILDFISRIPKARHDYELIVPLLPQEEQDRLAELIAAHPKASRMTTMDERATSDAIQRKWNTAGVRTRKPGGRKYRGRDD